MRSIYGKTYADRIAAARAWMRDAKWRGVAVVLGGGWWQIGSSRPIQGYGALAAQLLRRGFMVQVPGGYQLRSEPAAKEVANA